MVSKSNQIIIDDISIESSHTEKRDVPEGDKPQVIVKNKRKKDSVEKQGSWSTILTLRRERNVPNGKTISQM